MAMVANLSLSGVVDYRPDVFDELELPTPPISAEAIGVQADQLRATWTINKDDFIEFLCLRSMSMSLAVPDADFLKRAVGVWSRTHIHEWQLLFESLFYKYNPLWNKDGKITETGQDNATGSETETNTGNSSGSSTTTNYTHGYDGGTVHTDDGLSWTHAAKQKGTATSEASNTRGTTNTGQTTFTHTTLEQGNIGVTKSTELINDYRKTALFSVEEYIADGFLKNFCLMIW